LRGRRKGQVVIECPNTIFYLYVNHESEQVKIETFINNMKTVKRLELNDIYTWCNRQGIMYDAKFNYHKDFSLWINLKFYFSYSKQKMKYQLSVGTI